MSFSKNPDKTDQKDFEMASKVIAQLLQELAQSEKLKSKQDEEVRETLFVDSGFNNPGLVFQSDLQYGSYQGLIHG